MDSWLDDDPLERHLTEQYGSPQELEDGSAAFVRRLHRLMYGQLSWPRFDAIVARARRMRGWT